MRRSVSQAAGNRSRARNARLGSRLEDWAGSPWNGICTLVLMGQVESACMVSSPALGIAPDRRRLPAQASAATGTASGRPGKPIEMRDAVHREAVFRSQFGVDPGFRAHRLTTFHAHARHSPQASPRTFRTFSRLQVEQPCGEVAQPSGVHGIIRATSRPTRISSSPPRSPVLAAETESSAAGQTETR